MINKLKSVIADSAIMVALLTISLFVCCQTDPNIFRSEIAGIEIAKPDGWHFSNLETLAKYRASVKLKDEAFQEAMLQFATAPLFVALMHREPYETLNPSLQVLVRPLGSLSGFTSIQIMDLIIPTLQSSFENFKLVEPPTEFELGGLAAARLTATYIAQSQAGQIFPTKVILAVVPRNSYVYQIGFTSPPEGKDAISQEVVQKVYDSVRFFE